MKALFSTILKIFWNSDEQRIRAFWRICLMFLFMNFFLFVIGILLVYSDALRLLLTQAGMIFASLIATAGSMWLAGRFLDHRSLADFGFHLNQAWWLDFVFGLLLGAFLMTAIFLIEWQAGWITITATLQTRTEDQSFVVAIIPMLVIFVSVGIYEEMLMRGYILRNSAEGLNFRPLGPHIALILAWLLSSALFGLGHIFNPNTTIISTINIGLAGIFLGVAYVLTGELAIPIGVHITWNFFQGNVFGFPVSGIGSFAETTFIAIEQGGPDVWTGGTFGPEAGLIGIVAMLTGCVLVVGWVKVWYGDVRLQESLAHFTPRARAKRSGD